MANYRTHVTFGAGVGALAAGAGLALIPGLGWPDVILGAFFGFLGGMVPDLDHDQGRAILTISALMSTFLPIVVLGVYSGGSGNWTVWSLLLIIPCHYLLHWAIPQAKFFHTRKKRTVIRDEVLAIIIAAMCAVPALFFFKKLPFNLVYTWLMMLAIATGVQLGAPLLRLVTVHRGVWHSIPVVLIYAELIYLFLYSFPMNERLILSGAALAGALSHLILDEIYSVDFTGMRIKRSFGTALKFWDPKFPMESGFAYALAALIGGACFFV